MAMERRRSEVAAERARNYRLVQLDSVFTGLVTVAGTFLPVFLVRLGATGTEIGLLTSVPRMDRERVDRLDPIPGNPPSAVNLPPGCVFQPRCTHSHLVTDGACLTRNPDLIATEPDHLVRCHLPRGERTRIADQVLASLAGDPA